MDSADIRHTVGQVTPCAGVWIEIRASVRRFKSVWVTPCAGVWIEITSLLKAIITPFKSLPVRECGLK